MVAKFDSGFMEGYLEIRYVSLKPEHISAYSLIIEEGTAFYTLHMKIIN